MALVNPRLRVPASAPAPGVRGATSPERIRPLPKTIGELGRAWLRLLVDRGQQRSKIGAVPFPRPARPPPRLRTRRVDRRGPAPHGDAEPPARGRGGWPRYPRRGAGWVTLPVVHQGLGLSSVKLGVGSLPTPPPRGSPSRSIPTGHRKIVGRRPLPGARRRLGMANRPQRVYSAEAIFR